MPNKASYLVYITIGFLYIAVKVGFVSAGYLNPGAIAHGAIPAVVTILSGVLALGEYLRRPESRMWHRVALIVPVLVFIITPLFMYLKKGDMWLSQGRLPVLIIYEVFSVIQFILGGGIGHEEIQIRSE